MPMLMNIPAHCIPPMIKVRFCRAKVIADTFWIANTADENVKKTTSKHMK